MDKRERIGFEDLSTPLKVLVVLAWVWIVLIVFGMLSMLFGG